MEIPKPPDSMNRHWGEALFASAHELRGWAFDTFVAQEGQFSNPDHKHLRHASILFVWSSITFKRTGKTVVGTAQTGQQQGSLGKKDLLEWTYREWNFGKLPDFVITICAPFALKADPISICAVVEHELYHCGQALNTQGFPKFSKETNMPIFALRGHDIEEFTGVIRRYGAHDASIHDVQEALSHPPTIAKAVRQWTCGCGASV